MYNAYWRLLLHLTEDKAHQVISETETPYKQNQEIYSWKKSATRLFKSYWIGNSY